ncbi:peptide chain release factor 1 [Epithele typhae]|uniref:peptide chain release factor 1 n=1 Tax=Epithele typhae TaxID=378194 RepID=UPI002008BB90|nr:peptide chain release factor 1 [Epithele typhae]KAH9943038.1 peptide chain release factor 1 [Epithele typhae]
MFRSAARFCRTPPSSRTFFTSSTLRAQASKPAPAAEDAPILHFVRKKVQERDKLQSELSENALTDEDVKRVRRIRELEPLSEAFATWTRAKESLEETTPFLHDPDTTMKSMAEEEYATLTKTMSKLVEDTFPALLVPASKTSHLSAILEIRAGVGGSESALFVEDLIGMYTGATHSMGWSLTDAIVEVKGEGAYDALRWESGVHRVQRVPATESNGRVHTSTVSIMTLPLIEESSSKNPDDELFKMDDVRIEVMRARGAACHKTESAVRLTHVPTGITVSMQDERSQHQNRRRAFQVLRARLMDRKLNEDMVQRREMRRSLVSSADRSEKIRTYNYAQNLPLVMEGDGFHVLLRALQQRHDEELLEDVLSEQ